MQLASQIFRQEYSKIIKWLDEKLKTKGFLKNALLVLGLFFVFYLIGMLLPEGFDWTHFFKIGNIPIVWTPWTRPLVDVLSPAGFGLVFSLSMLGMAIRTYRYSKSPAPLALAVFSLPTMWVFFIGNLDGLVLFGLLIMPVGMPLVLLKPQLAAFALLARRNWFAAGAVWGIISLLFWGFWPLRMLMVTTPQWKAEWTQDITMFPWGLLLAVPLFLFSKGDEDLLMAAGSLITPHLFPYHFMVLMPALGRMRWYWMVLTWVISWTPLLANWLGEWAWHFGNLMSLCFWFGITFSLSAEERAQRRVFTKSH